MGHFKNSAFSAINVFYRVRFLPQRSSKKSNMYIRSRPSSQSKIRSCFQIFFAINVHPPQSKVLARFNNKDLIRTDYSQQRTQRTHNEAKESLKSYVSFCNACDFTIYFL